MVRKVDHIGVAVSNLEGALKTYTDVLGLELHGTEVVEEQKVRVAFMPVGDTEIELLESTDPEGPIAKFIEKRGQGMQHIALQSRRHRRGARADEAEGSTSHRRETSLRGGRSAHRIPAPQVHRRCSG